MPSQKKMRQKRRENHRRDASEVSSSMQMWIESFSKTPVMSSSSDPVTERLLCSICLDVFSDPVSTPCGHNFCKICLNTHWDNSQYRRCPNCNETFKQRPDLKINTTLRDLVDEHKRKSHEEQPAAEVVCDICTEGKLKAVKSCLVCQSSYCETHLESHLRVSGLQKHKLIDPVKNLQDYICQKHGRPLELFCRDDHTCVCLSCTDGDHKNHNTVPIEEETEEKKIQLLKTQTDMQQMIHDRIKKIYDIKHSTDLRRSELLEMMEEKQKAAEKHDEDVIKDLEQEITELKKRNIELEQISHTEHHLQLIQFVPKTLIFTRCSTAVTMNGEECNAQHGRPDEESLPVERANHQSVKTDDSLGSGSCDEVTTKEKTHLNGLRCQQKSLSALHLISQLFQRDIFFLWFLVPVGISLLMFFLNTEELKNNVVLKRMQQYAVDVTLDPDTANPYLILSDDKKQVRTGDMKNKLPDSSNRFNVGVIVLGKEGFSSGRFYYEVQVKGKTEWTLGVVRESVNRKGEITLTPVNGFWTVVLRNENEYKACADPDVTLSLSVKPQNVGVFVDYEEGLVSFYDLESRSHIYSYTDQSFTEKLYPYFGPCLNDEGKNSEPLIITAFDQLSFKPYMYNTG
ncbi:E3 ubiquitin-protein ligase TRIM39-like [Triplophysa dalaica]|uniref:E3 ubiquitin-protein ligase TRIM39-like n=1 Tax=Triplophysa dalaica TaxID=1582913 RepID=UPI0024DF433D|nr:E3 ubiquitin-protein ligase TRIM39-like [Triplophysa dalaica]